MRLKQSEASLKRGKSGYVDEGDNIEEVGGCEFVPSGMWEKPGEEY